MKTGKSVLCFFIFAVAVNTSVRAQVWLDNIGVPSSISTFTQGGLIDMTMPSGTPPSTWRSIRGGTSDGGLNIFANTTGPTDGPIISLHGMSLPPLPSGEVRAGSIYYNSYYNSNPSAPLPSSVGHRFLSYDANPLSPGFHTNMEIGNDGRTIVGRDVDYSFIQPGDQLTVRDQLGMFPSWSSGGNVAINGNATSSLVINANNGWNGASVALFSNTSSRPGLASFYSTGTVDEGYYGHMFLNYSTQTSFNAHMAISKDGHAVIGNNLIYSYGSSNPVPANFSLALQNSLSVQGGLIDMTEPPGVDNWRGIAGGSDKAGLSIMSNNSFNNGSSISMYAANSTSPDPARAGQIYYTSFGDNTSESFGHFFLNYDPSHSGFSPTMGIKKNGKVVIGQDALWNPSYFSSGNSTPDGYLLYVQKGILTERLKVAAANGTEWADFVFNTDYKLMPLNKVEDYVKEYKHLPEIPSASEVAKEGIDVAQMDAKLLQKIEELTLYAIEQQKQIEQQDKRITRQQKAIEELSRKISK